MAKSKTSSKGKKAQYAAYQAQNRCLTNKQKRVKKYLKNNPNAIMDIRALSGHTRKKPINSTLTKAQKRINYLMKYFIKESMTKEHVLKNLTQLKHETAKLRETWNLIEHNATIKGI